MRLNPDLLSDLGWIITKLLEKDRRLRYQSAAKLRADLKRVKRDTQSAGVPASLPKRPIEKRWKTVAVGVAAAACVSLVLLALLIPQNRRDRLLGSGVLAQREMEKRRSPLVWIPPCGRGFSRHGDLSVRCCFLLVSAELSSRPTDHRPR